MQSQTEESRQGEGNPFNVVHDDLANYSPSCQCCKRSNEHRARVNGHGEQYIFAGERRGTPLNLANLARRVIIPALAEYSDKVQHNIPWHGWHSFRTSLATILRSRGTDAKVVQAILRHASVVLILDLYTQVPSEDSRRALQKFEDLLSDKDAVQIKMSEPT
jgi:integrase